MRGAQPNRPEPTTNWPARMRYVLLIFPDPAEAAAWDEAGQPLTLPLPFKPEQEVM